jgi:hypothetical protein
MLMQTQLGATLTSPANAGSVAVHDRIVVGQCNTVEVAAMRWTPVPGQPAAVATVDLTMRDLRSGELFHAEGIAVNTPLARVVGGRR